MPQQIDRLSFSLPAQKIKTGNKKKTSKHLIRKCLEHRTIIREKVHRKRRKKKIVCMVTVTCNLMLVLARSSFAFPPKKCYQEDKTPSSPAQEN